MSPDQIRPIHKVLDRQREVSGKILDPLDLLIRAIEEAGTDSEELHVAESAENEAALQAWIEQCFGGSFTSTPLSGEALEIVAELAPTASMTDEFLNRVEAKRKAARENIDSMEAIIQERQPHSPGDVIRFFRERAGASLDRAAAVLETTPATLLSIEQQACTLLEIKPASLHGFASLVGEPLNRLLSLLRFAAKRLLTKEITSRANAALGRFDQLGDSSTARRERLKLAFARVADENRGYALFFQQAERRDDSRHRSVDL
jgi:hypothetical protein